MGKASKWFRSVFGLKNSDSSFSPSPSTIPPGSASKPLKDKRRWSFVKSYRESGGTKASDHLTTFREEAVTPSGHIDSLRPDKHAMTVAAAKSAVVEAAVDAAQAAAAAAAVVRLTSSGRCSGSIGTREEWAAIKIQAAFRGCLEASIKRIKRRALRALKGLVKLQALVRGDIDRKRTAEWLHRLHAVVRVQPRVRAGRTQILQTPFSNSKSSKPDFHVPATPDKFESPIRSKSMKFDHSSSLKRNVSKSHVQIHGNQEKCWDDAKSYKILEIDSGKLHFPPKRRNLFHSINYPSVCDNYSQSFSTAKDSKSHQSGQSTSSVDEGVVDSSQLFSVFSRNSVLKSSPFTPSRRDDSRSYLSSHSDYPSYMAYTESSKAKVRSLSAPKQRPRYERSSSSNRYSVQGLTTQKANALHANFTSKAYPGSGRLDKDGMPVGYRC
ncbi:protein IQ-DOMAIN 22 [Prosopis cineraria]|uniref:protein IQ-DOMAIN 22 n=1 Tax=Prosopis cineraria TaxID=364024 RepID=UPI00240F5D55|nr:protein IQ-DOMAIN 22 [Prosopis cineraria]